MMSTTTQLFRESPTLLGLLDTELVCRHISQGWGQQLGITLGDDINLPLGHLFEIDQESALPETLQQIRLDKESLQDLPVSIKGRNGLSHGLMSAWSLNAENDESWIALHISHNDQLDQALSKLQRLETEHSSILNAAGEGIYGLDANGLTIFANAASTEIVGWKIEDVIGKPAHDVHHHTRVDGSIYPRDECPVYAALEDGEVHHVDDEVFWHANGSPIPVEYTSTPIRQNGKLAGAVVVFRDISERKEIEKQREAAYREINHLKQQLELERDYLRDEINTTSDFGEIIGDSDALKRTMAQIDAVATTPANVLLLGESGVGKEMIARAIHAKSDRSSKPLVKVNCTAIPKDLFESEFFGHVKGAFTGAHRDRVGRMQLADGGTLFLDEIGEIPLDLQSKLLRVLQEYEFERVGDDKTIKVDVRIIAATNLNLEEQIKKGLFRQDLFYRLSVFPINVPPLRERRDDIAPIAQHFLNRNCTQLGRDPLKLSKQQVNFLKQHDWPGNIRELKNTIERAAILSKGGRARLDLVLPELATQETLATQSKEKNTEYLTDTEIREIEKNNIIAALRSANWQVWGKNGAAELLGIKASTLNYRMKVFDIRKENY